MLLRSGLIAAGIFWIAAPTWGEDPRPAPADSEVRDWIAQLNDDDYAVREEAARRLKQAGFAAIDALVEGLASDQVEVAWRCGDALEQIGLEADDATVDRIVQKIDAACARTGREGLKSLAKDLHARQKQFRRERAIAAVRKNGGQIVGTGIDGDVTGFADPFAMPIIVPAGPAIIIDEPIGELEAMPIPVPVEAVEPELPRIEVFELFGEIGRAIGRAIAPKEAAPDVAPKEEPAEAAVKEATEEAARAADEAAAAAKEAAAEAADAVDAAVEVVAVADAGLEFEGGDFGTEGWAQLRLDANWRGGDDGLSVLKDLPELTQIELNQTRLTDNALVHLAKLPRLAQLHVNQVGFSRDALLKFHKQRPSVLVYARGEGMMGIHGDMSSSPLVLTSVQQGSGAGQAGLQPGDVVHQIDGVKIRDFSDLTICVSARKAGDTIQVEYERGGEKKTVDVTLSARTD